MATVERKAFKLMVGRPVGLGSEKTDVGTFLMELAIFACHYNRIGELCESESISSRILLNRNIIAQEAINQKCDFLLMIDPDMSPDHYTKGENKRAQAKSFLQTSFQHMMDNPFGVIAAPACSERPKRLTNVFLTNPDGSGRRMTYSETRERLREPAIEQVHAIGTGLILIHVPIFTVLTHPYFDDVYANVEKTELSLSQDVYFTQNCHMAGVPVWCNWYAWAGHIKDEPLGAPEDLADEEEAAVSASKGPQKAPIVLEGDMGQWHTSQSATRQTHAGDASAESPGLNEPNGIGRPATQPGGQCDRRANQSTLQAEEAARSNGRDGHTVCSGVDAEAVEAH